MTSQDKVPDFVIPSGVLFRSVDDEMVLLNMSSEQYYGLDAVGADIVGRITSVPLDAAIAALSRDYDVDPEVLRADVDSLIGKLCGAGLLRVARHSS